MINFLRTHLRKTALFVGFGGAALVLLLAFSADRLLAREVLMIAPFDAGTVEMNRMLYADGDPVAEIYGNPLSKPVRVLFVGQSAVQHPEEQPELSLLPVDKSKGDNPLQVQTVWFFARFATAGLIILGVGGLFVPRRWSRRTSDGAVHA